MLLASSAAPLHTPRPRILPPSASQVNETRTLPPSFPHPPTSFPRRRESGRGNDGVSAVSSTPSSPHICARNLTHCAPARARDASHSPRLRHSRTHTRHIPHPPTSFPHPPTSFPRRRESGWGNDGVAVCQPCPVIPPYAAEPTPPPFRPASRTRPQRPLRQSPPREPPR